MSTWAVAQTINTQGAPRWKVGPAHEVVGQHRMTFTVPAKAKDHYRARLAEARADRNTASAQAKADLAAQRLHAAIRKSIAVGQPGQPGLWKDGTWSVVEAIQRSGNTYFRYGKDSASHLPIKDGTLMAIYPTRATAVEHAKAAGAVKRRHEELDTAHARAKTARTKVATSMKFGATSPYTAQPGYPERHSPEEADKVAAQGRASGAIPAGAVPLTGRGLTPAPTASTPAREVPAPEQAEFDQRYDTQKRAVQGRNRARLRAGSPRRGTSRFMGLPTDPTPRRR